MTIAERAAGPNQTKGGKGTLCSKGSGVGAVNITRAKHAHAWTSRHRTLDQASWSWGHPASKSSDAAGPVPSPSTTTLWPDRGLNSGVAVTSDQLLPASALDHTSRSCCCGVKPRSPAMSSSPPRNETNRGPDRADQGAAAVVRVQFCPSAEDHTSL